MIRVALICRDSDARARVRHAFARCTREQKLRNVDIKAFEDVEGVLQKLSQKRLGYIDYVICCADEELHDEETGSDLPLQGLHAMRAEYPHLDLDIISANHQDAVFAYELGAGFLSFSGTHDDFKRMVAERLSGIAKREAQCVTVRASGSVSNVVLDDIQFVESSKKGSIMHISNGETVLVRATLQSLFENLAKVAGQEKGGSAQGLKADPDRPAKSFFVMAGSSFIVNLDNVRSAGEGSFVFANGETIIVPIRKRKELKDALAAYRER